MYKTHGYAAHVAKASLTPFNFERRDLRPDDIHLEILYCGVCHSDLHQVNDDWHNASFPMVPGHEIVGRVTAVGAAVKKFKVGDLAGVGCMVDACGHCDACADHLEQYCPNFTPTYNGPDPVSGGTTYGGYSDQLVVKETFALTIPKAFSSPEKLAGVAPLLCAGITTYSPMRHWGVTKGKKVGVVGLGGLGHMGVKWAHAMGAHTVLFTTSPNKKADALKMGANEVVISTDLEAMQQHANSFDFILNTVAAPHDQNILLSLLRRDGTLCLIGVPDHPHPAIQTPNLIFGRKSLAGSLIGSIQETQEMLDFAAAHDILCDVEVINMAQINDAYARMVKSDVKYRFVIDMASIK